MSFEIENWRALRIESATFLFHEADKYLHEQLETAKQLTGRAESIIKFCVPAFLLLIAYIVKVLSDKSAYPFVFWVAVYSAIALGAIIALSLDAFWIYQIKPLGNTPKNMIRDDRINDKDQELFFVVSRICSIQRMIEVNTPEIKIRLDNLKLVNKVVQAAVIGGLVITAIRGVCLIV